MATPLQVLLCSFLLLLVLVDLPDVNAYNRIQPIRRGQRSGGVRRKRHRPPFKPGPWKIAHATFYGGSDASGTVGGACGYGDPRQQGYGIQTTAVSTAMFNNGEACGACYEIKCTNDKQWCKPGSVFVTATNLCPDGGWCSPPKEHFDLSEPAFLQIAQRPAGHVPVEYRRFPCKKQGGIRFTVTGNPYFTLVHVWNVGGSGDVTSLSVKGDRKVKWTPMKRNWGQKWETNAILVGESLTFRVRTSDGRCSTSWHVAPKNWQFEQTFEGKNFKSAI